MQFTMIKSFFLLLVLASGCLATIDITSLAGEFKNIRVLRVLDLTSSIVKEDIGIRAKNIKPSATDVYYFILPSIYRPFIASYQAHSKEGLKEPLQMESIGLDVTQ
jgi:oligosaccharyltransferase complex subunit alpha (ribophorin I)